MKRYLQSILVVLGVFIAALGVVDVSLAHVPGPSISVSMAFWLGSLQAAALQMIQAHTPVEVLGGAAYLVTALVYAFFLAIVVLTVAARMLGFILVAILKLCLRKAVR